MSNYRYLEIDSTYRDRTRFPKPGYFEIPISQSGRKNLNNAVDPVALSAPVNSWTSNNLSLTTFPTFKLLATVEPKTTALSGLTDTTRFIINSVDRLQQKENYYSGLVVEDAAFFNRRKIKYYKFLGSFSGYDRAEIVVVNPFPETFVPTNQIYIYDPTDLTNPSYPFIFIPYGRELNNSYIKYLIYNETLNEYRKVKSYTVDTNTALLDTSDGGDIVGWLPTHNYSAREEIPFFPTLGASNPIVTNSSTSQIQVDVNLAQFGSMINKFIRILPVRYNFELFNESDNECRRITAYDEPSNSVTVFPPFSNTPTVGRKIELLSFSYDNLNPFVYTGSVLSQQELVCYEMDLLSLVLPTELLKVLNGGIITQYRFVYVELSNTCSVGTRNVLYSNNPNSTRALFKVPIFDIQDPPYFIKIGGGSSQTVKFKPNDTLLFSVTMSNGEVFETICEEQFSPLAPEPRIQITAMFGLKRIV
jgi:hypothetical protein